MKEKILINFPEGWLCENGDNWNILKFHTSSGFTRYMKLYGSATKLNGKIRKQKLIITLFNVHIHPEQTWPGLTKKTNVTDRC